MPVIAVRGRSRWLILGIRRIGECLAGVFPFLASFPLRVVFSPFQAGTLARDLFPFLSIPPTRAHSTLIVTHVEHYTRLVVDTTPDVDQANA